MVSEEEEIIAKLQSSFSCLGFSCMNAGTYRDGNGLDCVDPDFSIHLLVMFLHQMCDMQVFTIFSSLQFLSKFETNDASVDQRAEIVVKALSVMILCMQALQELHEGRSNLMVLIHGTRLLHAVDGLMIDNYFMVWLSNAACSLAHAIKQLEMPMSMKNLLSYSTLDKPS